MLSRLRAPLLLVSLLVVSGSSQGQPAAETAPPAKEAAPPPPAGAEKPKEADKPKEPTAGYSWTDKRARRTVPRAKVRRDDPIATYPGFMMLPDGTSQVWVQISKKVPVQVSQAKGRVTFTLTGSHVAITNNTNPLVTEYFDTPLRRARLVRDKGGAQLVLELREGVTPQHKLEDGPAGTMLLRITLPKAVHSYSLRESPSRRYR